MLEGTFFLSLLAARMTFLAQFPKVLAVLLAKRKKVYSSDSIESAGSHPFPQIDSIIRSSFFLPPVTQIVNWLPVLLFFSNASAHEKVAFFILCSGAHICIVTSCLDIDTYTWKEGKAFAVIQALANAPTIALSAHEERERHECIQYRKFRLLLEASATNGRETLSQNFVGYRTDKSSSTTIYGNGSGGGCPDRIECQQCRAR